MRLRNSLLAATITLVFAGTALGAVSKEEAKQLGESLTEMGAEKAGNKEGTIPPYTGGLTTPPAGYVKGSGRYVDPFPNEKPLFTITKENMSKYADKLTEASKVLLMQKKGFRIDVYPTHRTAAQPDYVKKGTLKCATTSQLTPNKNAFTGCLGGVPFPIPKNGNEVMWNHLIHFKGETAYPEKNSSFFVDSSGRPMLVGKGTYYTASPYWYKNNPRRDPFLIYKGDMIGPPRKAGENYLVKDYIDITKNSREGYMYMVGQRRVRTAPDLSYDSPNPTIAGSSTCDDGAVFSGPLDRLDFKLIGKKEMYVPYNQYKLLFSPWQQVLKPGFINPDLNRWELHRVWVIESTPKAGRRHLYSKRYFYIDEDSWCALANDAYDQKGKLYRGTFAQLLNSYDALASSTDSYTTYDFAVGGYAMVVTPFAEGNYKILPPLPENEWNPESLATGIH